MKKILIISCLLIVNSFSAAESTATPAHLHKQTNQQQETAALKNALDNNYPDGVAKAIMRGAGINQPIDTDDDTPLINAINNLISVSSTDSNTYIPLYLISFGANINKTNKYGVTPLMALSNVDGDTETYILSTANLLLQQPNLHINAKDQSGWTALMWAASKKNADLTRLLLAKKNINIQFAIQNLKENGSMDDSPKGSTALIIAAKNLEFGDTIKTPDSGKFPVQKKPALDIMQQLIKHHANINARNCYGYSPLVYAIKQYNLAAVELLIKHHAHIGPMELYILFGQSANDGGYQMADMIINHTSPRLLKHNVFLGLALKNNYPDYQIKEMLKKDAHINDSSVYFPKALQGLLSSNRPNKLTLAKDLIKHGAQVNGTDKYDGYTPLQLAQSTHDAKLIAYLKQQGAK